MNQLNEAQKILQEKLEFGLLNSLLRNQRASTSLRRTELTKDSVITKLGIYDEPNKIQEIEDKTCIVYNTALTRDYLRDKLNLYKEWKVFKYEEFAAITNSVIEIFLNGRKIWFKDIEVRVRKDVVYLLIPKIEINEIRSITIFELPEMAFNVSYNSESDIVSFPKEWKNEKDLKSITAYNNEGYYNRVVINPKKLERITMEEEVNIDWNNEEFESFGLRCKTLNLNLNDLENATRDLIDNEKGFLFETPLIIDSNTYSSESLKVFNAQGELLNSNEYELEILFRNKETNKYNYLFRTKTKEEFSLVLHNNEWTQLNQFYLTNILQRFDRFEHWLDRYKEDYNSLPNFVKNFKNLHIDKNILDISNNEERFEKVLSEYIKHHPEWYNEYLNTIKPDRFIIRYSDLNELDLKKFNNYSEVESKFQRVDFGISEYMMLTIRNEDRNDNIAIYMNGLKYLGIRHIVHARNFSYIYILKQALPDILDENSYFEVILKDEAYKFYSHTSLFDGDCMMVMGKDIEFISNIEEKLNNLKFFHNGRRLRKEDIYYNTDSDGNHSFFFNIKTYAGDYLAVEMSNHVCKEIKYIENLPEDGVLNIIKNSNFRYPLSSKYYEIYINGRRINYYNEHFITNFMLQFKTIKGNHNICIYEIGGLDKEIKINEVFNSSKDEWDTYIKSLSNIDKYKVENTIINEDAYNKYIYTLAQYRMHLFYWWFLVPRVRKLDCNPFKVSTAPEVIQEIEKLFPDFIDGVGTAVLDTHHQQTSVMYLGHGLEGYIANMLYVLDNIIPAFKPTDSNDYYVMRNLPYFKTENDTVQINANVNGIPSLRVVPRTHMTQEEYELAETPNFDDIMDEEDIEDVIVIDANRGM